MRATTPALASVLAARRASKDAALLMADCYTFTLRSGLILAVTNADVPIALNGTLFAADSLLVDGLAFKCATGLDVDQQRVTIAARATDTVGGVPFLVALQRGLFDGCALQRERVFLQAWGSPPIGSVVLFKGRVTSIDEVGRTSAQVTVASDLVLLDVDMPRNLYQPTCNHTLYDSGCGLIKNAFGTAGMAAAGSTATAILWPGAAALHVQGTMTFTAGANAGSSATVKSAVPGSSLTLAYPLAALPAGGDAFTVYQGCDHTSATCRAKFDNLARFRGFPFVPPPASAY